MATEYRPSENETTDVNGSTRISQLEHVQSQQSTEEHRVEVRRLSMECRQNSEVIAGKVQGHVEVRETGQSHGQTSHSWDRSSCLSTSSGSDLVNISYI